MTHARERFFAILRAAVRVLRPVERDHTDNPPPGGYFPNGEWRDPEPRRNYNVDPSTLLRSPAFTAGFVMALLYTILAAYPAHGQTPADGTSVAPRRSSLHLQGEPDVPRGMVAVRIINHTDCQIAIRLRRDGVTLGTAAVPVHDGRSIHAKPDTSAMEVEVVADPRLCAPTTAPVPSPLGPRASLPLLLHHRLLASAREEASNLSPSSARAAAVPLPEDVVVAQPDHAVVAVLEQGDRMPREVACRALVSALRCRVLGLHQNLSWWRRNVLSPPGVCQGRTVDRTTSPLPC